MYEQLEQLFESSVLNEDSKKVLTSAFEEAINSKEQELKTKFESDLVEEKAKIVDEVNEAMQEAIQEELGALAEEIEHARTLEVKYAEKLQEFKETYAEKYQENVKQQIDSVIEEELSELKADIENAKKHEFVMQMYESFADVHRKMFGDTDISIHDELERTKAELMEMKHEQKLNELLESVTGQKREVAKVILESVPYDKLEKKFNSIKGILLAESTSDEKEDAKQLEESKKEEGDETPKGKIVMEGEQEPLTESDEPVVQKMPSSLEQRLAKSLRFAGVAR